MENNGLIDPQLNQSSNDFTETFKNE